MMAFVGTSMAKTGEVEVKKENLKTKQEKVVLLTTPCEAADRAAMNWYWNNVPDPSFNAGVALRKAVAAASNAG